MLDDHVQVWRNRLAPFAFYLAATVWLTWPIARDAENLLYAPVTTLGDLRMDVLLVNWILAWDVHALATDPAGLFDANILHPTQGTLALSEHLIGGLPLYLPFYPWGGPTLAYNGWLLSSFVLSGLFMHWLVRRWTGDEIAAYAAGIAYTFAPWRCPYGLGSPHLLQVQYYPLILLTLDLALAKSRTGPAICAGLLLGIQALCSYYLGYQGFLIAAAVMGAAIVAEGLGFAPRVLRTGLIAGAVAVAVVAPLSVPYVLQKAHAGLAELGSWGPTWTQLWLHIYLQRVTAIVGYGSIALGGVAAATALARIATVSGNSERRRLLSCITVALLGLILTRGPIPLPFGIPSLYSVLSAVVPGFAVLRSPDRFAYLVVLGCAVLIGYLMSWCRRSAWMLRRPGLRLLSSAAIVIGVSVPAVFFSSGKVLPFDAGAVPEVYRWLKQFGEGGPVLVVGSPRIRSDRDAIAMHDSIGSWYPLVNGYTGHMPPYYDLVSGMSENLPDAGTLRQLAGCTGVRWIVASDQSDARIAAWSQMDGAREVDSFPGRTGTDYLYEVEPGSNDGCRDRLFDQEITIDGNPTPASVKIVGEIGVAVPEVWPVRTERQVVVAIRNRGDTIWPATALDGERRVVLELSWIDQRDRRWSAAQPIIPTDVAPGLEVVVPVWVRSPFGAGQYDLEARVSIGSRPRLDPRWVADMAEAVGAEVVADPVPEPDRQGAVESRIRVTIAPAAG